MKLFVAVSLFALGCSSSSTTRNPPSLHAATRTPSGDGAGGRSTVTDEGLPDVVFEMSGQVDAGGESQNCAYVRMPDDRGPIAVNTAQSDYTPGSHHFLVYRTTLTDLPVDSAAHECGVTEQIANVSGSYYEAQTPKVTRALPEGVAHVFLPGEVLLLTAHYLNASAKRLDTHVTFTLHTMDPEKVVHEAGSIFFYNYQIDIPPLSDVTVTRDCPVSSDINLALLWSHMHARGVGFVATTNDQDANDRVGPLFEAEDWAEPVAREFPSDPPVVLHAGSTIRYSCDYHNTTTSTFVQGPSAQTNEMCILHGMYWPRQDSATELCLGGVSTSQ